MADDDPWSLKVDGYLNVDTECKSIIYHPNLNVVLITTADAQVYVFDVNSGVILQKTSLSGRTDGKITGVYLAEGLDKVLYTDGRVIGVRSDYNGVLLLDTILQTPVSCSEDKIKLELLLTEAILLHLCLRCVELPVVDHVQEVLQELSTKIQTAQEVQKKSIKAQKWNTVCLELPHAALKLVCSGLVAELKRQNRHIPALPIASAINEQLNGLLPGLIPEVGPADRILMFSEAARRNTFAKWPHMNYKDVIFRWALPDQMAQAGFYHQPNSTGDDRAMCFTCNVCLVFWEPTDEPWSEHERHAPSCPFVNGEYTQNVPFSVVLATGPAQESDDSVEIISTTNVKGLIATASHNGLVNVWNVSNQLQKEMSVLATMSNEEASGKEGRQNQATNNLAPSYLPTLGSEPDAQSDYKPSLGSQKLELTALTIAGGPKPEPEELSNMSTTVTATILEPTSVGIRPCLICGVSVTSDTSPQIRTLENVWAALTDSAPASSLVRAMNSVNSAASDSLDIMKVADRSSSTTSHRLIVYDFHHKVDASQPTKSDKTKDSKTKKVSSGTGTSASSNSGRQESLYQELFLSEFSCKVPVIEDVIEDVVIEDVDEMVIGAHFDALIASSSNGQLQCSTPINIAVPPTSFPFDANFNPINGSEQFASASDITALNKKTLELTSGLKTEPVIVQTVVIDAPEIQRVAYAVSSRDGRHLYVALCPGPDIALTDPPPIQTANRMDVDEESEFLLPKSYMYWDQNEVESSKPGANEEERNDASECGAILLVYAFDLGGKVLKLIPEPIVRRELPAAQIPVEHVLLPLQEKNRNSSVSSSSTTVTSSQFIDGPKGQIAMVCKDGVVRILELATLKTLSEAKLEGTKFVSATYCNSLERLCACTNEGALHFFATIEEEDSTEEKEDIDDVNMTTEVGSRNNVHIAPSTSTSSVIYQDPILAHRTNLSYSDLRMLYELTRFNRHSPAYGATVPPCWSEMMQAQRQRRHPQHLHQSEDQHHTRTWRLQNDATTWDEHVFELTLPRSATGTIGHVDVRFSLHSPCPELPAIQVTLLKQKITGIGYYKSSLTPVDERIHFDISGEQKAENPVTTEEYLRQHNTEILCGPINLQRCTDLSDHSGCVTLTSPRLFRSKARTILVHIKALIDPVKDKATTKSRINIMETKPQTSKKLKIGEAGPLLPGAIVERLAASANKKLECYIGCDWIHEISITLRSVHSTDVPNERIQRCSMFDSKMFIDNILNVACLQGSEKSPVVQSLALDVLIWVVAIQLTRLRVNQKVKIAQLETIRSVQSRLSDLLCTGLLHAGRSIAHKCVKLIILCSEGLHNLDEPLPHAFDEAVLSVLVTLLPSVAGVQWAGSLRWLAILIIRLLPLDRNHSIAQQCITLVQQIATEMSNRVNPYHLLLATRFGLYNTPFEMELFDVEPPMPAKFSSMPITYASIVTGEQAGVSITANNSLHSQDTIDLRDLLALPAHPTNELKVPSKLRALCANNNMKGLLEVEPLHFTCHAASDGTKMEKIDPGINTVNIGTALYESTNANTNKNSASNNTNNNNNNSNNHNSNPVPDIKIISHSYNLGAVDPDLQAKLTTKLSNLLSQYKAEMSKKPATLLSLTPDDQSDSDEANNMPGEFKIWHNAQNDASNPHMIASSKTKEKSSVPKASTATNKIEDNHDKKREDYVFPWGRLLCWPPQHVLVVERMHSGARRFVVLDFGSPVLLTDLMIPSCSDLVSLSIDIWTKSEESDGTRLFVAGDIGTKPLVVSDLQPPPVCRYLKITTIGRYGMSTTRCKIPLGMFYGHMLVLPGEDYSELNSSQVAHSSSTDANMYTSIEAQCSILSALAEDVQCRFSLATERLKSLLDPLLCTETPNVVHMQNYLHQSKPWNENIEQSSTKILSTYQECMTFQHQLNIVRGVWRRLESWRGSQDTPVLSLGSAPTDKLKVLGETLLDILLYTVYEIGPVPSIPITLCDVFTPSICDKFFHSICVVTAAPRLQLYAVALLARVAGHQPWWGDFLANTLINLYSASCTHIFPQDRVFILLTFLGRKSLIAGANKSSVIDAMVRTLGRLLAPLSYAQGLNTSRLDTTLIGWVLLFLSVCLDTTVTQPVAQEENNEKYKDQALSTRWEFIQGESAMQRKFVNASRSSASRSYRRKLQKRLMHHKQQLQNLEQAKKALNASTQVQALSALSSQAASLSSKLEAAFKQQEHFFKKTLKQHSAKHCKDLLSIRRNESQHLSRSPRLQPQPCSSKSEGLVEVEAEPTGNLSHTHCLPVARSLVALILNNAANVDMFLLACKVVARLIVSTRPAISLGELMTEEQLFKLVRLGTGASDAAWASHAVACLLQDLLEGGRLFPKTASGHEGSPSEESFDSSLAAEENTAVEEDTAGAAQASCSATTFGNEIGEADVDGDEDTQDSVAITSASASTSKSNGFTLPSLFESDDSELEDFLDDILERGRNLLKKGNAVSKFPISAGSGISLAVDTRLEYGVETGVEIALRRLSTLGACNLPLSVNATIQVHSESSRYTQSEALRNSGWTDRTQDNWNTNDSVPSSLHMLTRCFEKIFTDLYLQNMGTSLQLVLQLWLTLNLDGVSEPSSNSSLFDPSLLPAIPLSSAAISGLISALSWHPGVSLRVWCLALQCLTLASNQPLKTTTESIDVTNSSQPLDGLVGGMASCIIKEPNIGPMLLRLFSGNGLNVDTMDKQYVMAGPTVCQALQDFLVRLEMRCDVISPSSSLGNALKELLLWVVYQLVQPGGALVARRGPLDAQCKLITSLINLNFANTDLGTAMSISECVGVLVSSYVRGSGVGAQCGGAVDNGSQSGGFGGLFACVLGGDSRQGRPASWDTLVVALIKLVCKLIQTPLPNARPTRQESASDMEMGEATPRCSSNSSVEQENLNTSQTDESKVAEQQTSYRIHQPNTAKRVPCVADTVLQHEPTMMRLLGALGHSTGSSLAMLLGEGAGATTELGDPSSIPDATFQLLSTLTRKSSSPSLVLNPLYQYLASSCGQIEGERQLGVMQLSEPLLWYILRVLDNEASLAVFTSMGGVKVLCNNLVKASSSSSGSNSASPGVIALVMQHLSNSPHFAHVAASNKKSPNSLESYEDGLLNFAPLGTISWSNPTAQPADVLIQSAAPHKRARTAAWSYHFYPDEAWVDLTVTLPCAILLREVELQPHLTALATCPSAVALEISREGNSTLTPVCPPMPTAGLTFIRLTLSQPEVATAVLVRLYKPRDSTNIGLSQIRLLGTTAFGEVKTTTEAIDEEQLTKTSLGWLRLVHQCLSVSMSNSSLAENVLNSAASVEGLMEACCNLLLLPAPSLFTPNLERVLLQLGLHSRDLGLRLINFLLNNRSTVLLQAAGNQQISTVQLVVELLQQLCCVQDEGTEARILAVLSWLYNSATNAVTRFNTSANPASPSAVYVHSISAIIWKAHKRNDLNYDLQSLLTNELFNALYEWSLTLGTYSALKQAIDAAICALCYVRPTLFPLLLQRVRILVPNLATDHSASISDDRKESEGQTDDRKSENDAEEWYCRLVLPDCKRLHLTEGQLLTVAAAARSPQVTQQLIDSGLPALLTASIAEFCTMEKQKQGLAPDVRYCTGIMGNQSLTDNDKAGESSHQTNNNSDGLCMTEPESISMVLEFLSLLCSEGRMRDWLGREGRNFWLPLLSLLSNRPIQNPSICLSRCSETNVSYSGLESAMIKFLSRCCWCHPVNQKLLAEVLTDVILQQRTPPSMRYLHGISGFTRRLILQLLLEGEKVSVAISSEVPMKVAMTDAKHNMPSMPPHPAHPLGHYHQLLYLPTRATVADILQQVSGTWLPSLLPSSCKGTETNASGTSRTRELWESGLALVADSLSVAAGNTAKDKRAKEVSNRTQTRGPILRIRSKPDGTPMAGKSSSNSLHGGSPNTANQQFLTHISHPDVPLPPQLTVAQLLAIAGDSGTSLSEPCLYLSLRQCTKESKEDMTKQSDNDLLEHRSAESSLGVFSLTGGLAVLATHLPLVYPDSGRSAPFTEKSPSPEQPDADWVKVEASDDIYEDLEGVSSGSPRAPPPTPHIPPHSLAAFGLFLRLPGYAEVLLRDRKRAQCLLRLALGVLDDGDGGDVLASPLAASLPTLPFQVLKQLLETTPPTTDDGLLLRRTMIDVGAVHLLLNCLAVFTHQTGSGEGVEQKTGQSSGRSDDKSHLYWAKGTGFGTGSTQQSWNVEQALLRQRSEEEHVTVLLQVIASYVGPGGPPQRELPVTFGELLARSCLLPALSSYLRNDSVLDMARHIPLYRAILQLLRAMALSAQLAPLLLPRTGRSNEPSIVSLLSSMKVCVNTYMHKINRTKSGKSKTASKYTDDTEQDEGLATLIPDIQESAAIVQNATSRLAGITEELAGPSPIASELPLRSVEQRYLEVMKNLQFDTYEMITENSDAGGYKFVVSYHFESNMRAAGERSHPTRVKRLAQEAVTLSTALPLSYSSSVFVRCDADRLDVMKVLITGPAETPYANGCFEFDVYFPPEYPNSPMMINLETTGRHTVRFNPNLYNDGKVCLSILNTWQGRPEEKWNAHTSSFLQVLVSIQSLILVAEPYFNEPGYERSRGTSSGAQSSQEYNANICQATAKWAMLEQIRNPCPCFKEVIHTHFWIKRHEIVAQLEGWIRDMEQHGADRRSGRTISLNALALKRHYRLLRDELNKLPTPEGLEDLVEPLPSPGSPLELVGTPGSPSTPPTPTTTQTSVTSNAVTPVSNIEQANILMHHDIDTDVEMEKMVSKVCE
ncbi:baculoviral IAP repeat-containing protein 6 isoform X2 [Neodiprion pinetum]|uniref:baculoviral IAP repeat-containing protein 6 isoform X2 n=1 Tax=Neodiprion pinetum TaxID=441929 RepID=UPI001EDF0EF5|nr:baculoviral IAP repeat-containing protein 6-like isoform X2 [Neodiprion pinetum]